MKLTNEQILKLSSIASKLGREVTCPTQNDIFFSQDFTYDEYIDITTTNSTDKIVADVADFADTFDTNLYVAGIISNNPNDYHDMKALINNAEYIKKSLIDLKNALTEADIFADTNKVTELCPYCEEEVKLEAIKYKLQECPNCHKKIRACSLCDCDTCDCSKCEKQEDEDEDEIETFDTYDEAYKYLEKYAKDNSIKNYAIVEDSYEVKNGLLFIEYDENGEEIDHYPLVQYRR